MIIIPWAVIGRLPHDRTKSIMCAVFMATEEEAYDVFEKASRQMRKEHDIIADTFVSLISSYQFCYMTLKNLVLSMGPEELMMGHKKEPQIDIDKMLTSLFKNVDTKEQEDEDGS